MRGRREGELPLANAGGSFPFALVHHVIVQYTFYVTR